MPILRFIYSYKPAWEYAKYESAGSLTLLSMLLQICFTSGLYGFYPLPHIHAVQFWLRSKRDNP